MCVLMFRFQFRRSHGETLTGNVCLSIKFDFMYLVRRICDYCNEHINGISTPLFNVSNRHKLV